METKKEKIAERELYYGERLGKMIRCETVSSRFHQDLSKFYRFHEVLEELFPNLHKTCEKHEFNGSLLFKWKGKGNGEPILFMSHQDVVEANGDWEHDPFGGEIADGAVWGRGTVDTKGNLFCFLQAAEELMEKGYVPECDVYFASSCTEEISGEGAPLTVQWLQDHGVHLRFLMDEGGMIKEEPMKGVKGRFAMVGCLEKGYGDVKFIARGNGGHASVPQKNTPLTRLAAFMLDVEKHNPFTPKMNATVAEMFRRLAPYTEGSLGKVMRYERQLEPLLEKLLPKVNPLGAAMISTTLNFTMAKGADGLNVVPQEAYVTGNMRFIHHQGVEESVELVSKIARKYQIETELLYFDRPCPVVDYKGKPFRLVEHVVNKLFPGVVVAPYAMTGGTDAKFYTPVCENSLRFAPLEINEQQYQSIHGLNENINLDTLPKAVDFYKRIVRHMEGWKDTEKKR